MISYYAISAWLEHASDICDICEVYTTLVGPVPAYTCCPDTADAMNEALCTALEAKFPVHECILTQYDEMWYVVPFNEVVHFCGFEFEYGDWEAYSPALKLMICLAPGYTPDTYALWEMDGAVMTWWAEQQRGRDLPNNFDGIGQVLETLRSAPVPWNGLNALARLIIGQEGNAFVDWPCSQVQQSGWNEEAGWNMATVDEFAEEYAWAEKEIFAPIYALEEHVTAHTEALGTCIDLLYGRVTVEELEAERG